MTTDAPPEKMMNAEVEAVAMAICGATGRQCICQRDNRSALTCEGVRCKAAIAEARAAIEAARRLSAPAPAAPRVGDDEPTKAMLIAGLERGLAWMKEHGVDGLSPWQDYPRPVDTLKVVYAAMRGAALSAPPAASAVEREKMAEEIFSGVHPRWMWKTWPDEGDPDTYGRKSFRAMADAALGYRKLAPAQSVGQSAAQGVGNEVYLSAVQGRRDFRMAYDRMLKACREARRRLEKGRALWNGPCHETAAVLDEALNGSRLSALPKGQDDEG